MPNATLTFGFNATVQQPDRSVGVTFDGETHLRLELTGAQTYAVDLAMMPTVGLKGLRVFVDIKDAAGATVSTPITLRWTSNSVQKSEELSPGGVFQLGSPSPTHGITALDIISTANAVVYVNAVG